MLTDVAVRITPTNSASMAGKPNSMASAKPPASGTTTPSEAATNAAFASCPKLIPVRLEPGQEHQQDDAQIRQTSKLDACGAQRRGVEKRHADPEHQPAQQLSEHGRLVPAAGQLARQLGDDQDDGGFSQKHRVLRLRAGAPLNGDNAVATSGERTTHLGYGVNERRLPPRLLAREWSLHSPGPG